MKHTKQAITITIAVLVASIAAFGQNGPRNRARANVVKPAVEAFGLTEEQVDQIREIRRERPPRNQSREDFQAWRDEQRAEVQGVLTDEQKAQVAELEAAREKMRTYAGAAFLGLTDSPASPRGMRPGRARFQRAGRRSRPGSRQSARPAFRQSTRGRPGPSARASNRGPRAPAARARGGRPGPDWDRQRARRPARG